MSEATRTRTHAPEVRQRAVEILQEGVGHRALAAELGIPQATARQWARAYAVAVPTPFSMPVRIIIPIRTTSSSLWLRTVWKTA